LSSSASEAAVFSAEVAMVSVFEVAVDSGDEPQAAPMVRIARMAMRATAVRFVGLFVGCEFMSSSSMSMLTRT
jgi:hypothetical protein